MNPSVYTILFLSFFFIPLAIFSVVAIFARPLTALPGGSEAALDDYLISSRSIQQYDFVNSSAAYMLQVSTTFYFVFWGYNYGLSNIWYLVSWGLGILAFSYFAPKLLSIRMQFETLPSFLAGGKFSTLRTVSATVTILAFLAIFYVESYFCVDFISILSNPHGNQVIQPVWWVFFLVLTLLTVLYSLFGGMRRVVITDRWQLALAYFCLAIVFSYLITRSFVFAPLGAFTVAVFMLGIFGVLILLNRGLNNRPIINGSLYASFCILILTTLWSFRVPSSLSLDAFKIHGPFAQVLEPWGLVTLLGFTIVNLLWQFCDNTAYQRIASLDLNGLAPEEAARKLRRLLRRLIFLSPLTWGLGIVLGIAIRTAGVKAQASGTEYIDLLASMKGAALSGDWFAIAAVLALSAALTAIMMETVDMALITFAQSYHRDIVRNKEYKTWRLIGISAFAYLAVVAFAVVHKNYPNASILTVMGGSYSALVVLSIPAIFKMIGLKVPDGFVISGIVIGFVLTWIATFGPGPQWPWNVKIVLPFFAGPLGSAVPMFLGLLAGRGRHA